MKNGYIKNFSCYTYFMERKPIVAIVGRPNVGKSTLVNRLVGSRNSIVDDLPGVTRDRIYADVTWLDKSFTLIDTGGIEPDSGDIILSQMREQAEIAIETADTEGNEEFDEEVLHMRQLLKSKLADMDLSVRALNCLKAADVETLGELVKFNKNDLLKFRNFGKKSLTELDELLESLNLSFGMDITKYKLDKE